MTIGPAFRLSIGVILRHNVEKQKARHQRHTYAYQIISCQAGKTDEIKRQHGHCSTL